MASTFPPGPRIFSFLIFLSSSVLHEISAWSSAGVVHTPKHVFLISLLGLHNFWMVFLFPSSNRPSPKEFSVSLFWFKMDWKTRWNKRALFLVSMLENKKRKRKWTQNLCEEHFLFPFKQKKRKLPAYLSFHLLFLGQIPHIFVYIHLIELWYVPNALSFQNQLPAPMHTSYSIILKAQQN